MPRINKTAAAFILSTFLLISSPVSGVSAEESTPSSDQPWTAQQAVAYAIAENPDASLALHRIEQSEAAVNLANSANFPRINISTEYAQTDNPMYSFGNILNQGAFDNTIDFNDPGRTDNLQLKALITYRLYNGGKDEASQLSADIELDIQKLELELVHQQLGFEVVRSFQNIIQAAHLVGVRQESLAAITASVNVGRARFDAGDLLKQDLLNLELQQSRAAENLIQSKHQLELAKRAFLNLLGLTDSDIAISMAPDIGQQLPENLNSTNRLELQKIALLKQVAQAHLKKAEGNNLPTIDGFASYQVDTGFVLDETGDSWMAGVKLDYALYTGKQTTSEIAIAQVKLKEIQTLHKKTELALNLDIQKARLDYEQALERIKVTEKMVTVAGEVTKLSRARFKEGVILASDLIDFEMRLSDAQLRHLTARTALQIAIANLRRAAGLQQFPM